ncbi:hypothetical protein GCM10025876_21280 [Demequina litorisediminis]|uniref:NADP-dependent oxidoreductase domain-containing protein n=1 Tax=Demequina litorisediminis TaxID=1849022 RepID=A0ABQ6IGS7_9MICO|nr:hypothetical protein GCM10025876_21280 [Demequina litorisediminis]
MYQRGPEEALIPTLEDEGVGSIVFSPLAQGMLTDRYLNGVPEGSRATHSRFLSENQITDTYLERTRALNDIAAGRGQSLAQARGPVGVARRSRDLGAGGGVVRRPVAHHRGVA